MKKYLVNSPEAIARLITMFMATNNNKDSKEIEALESLDAYQLLGLSQKAFTQIVKDYFNDISDEADETDGIIHLIDKTRIDALLDDVTDQHKRILTCALIMDICKSDGDISKPEIILLRYMMDQWNVRLEDIEAQFARP